MRTPIMRGAYSIKLSYTHTQSDELSLPNIMPNGNHIEPVEIENNYRIAPKFSHMNGIYSEASGDCFSSGTYPVDNCFGCSILISDDVTAVR